MPFTELHTPLSFGLNELLVKAPVKFKLDFCNSLTSLPCLLLLLMFLTKHRQIVHYYYHDCQPIIDRSQLMLSSSTNVWLQSQKVTSKFPFVAVSDCLNGVHVCSIGISKNKC